MAVVILLGLGVLGLTRAGVTRSLDGWIFDRLVEWSPSPTLSSRSVLVAASDRDLAVAEILDLAERLHRNGARATAFVRNTPRPLDTATLLKLSGWKACVISGRRDRWDHGAVVPASSPPGGIWRGVEPAPPLANTSTPVLEPRMAQLLGLAPSRDGYYLDFRVRREGFQRVDADRLLAGDLPRSLVEGMVVLVGRDSPADSLITTPVHRGPEALSPLLFQAAVIDALERDGMVHLASPPLQWSIAFLLAAGLVVILWRGKRGSVLGLTIAGGGLAVIAAWVALWQFQWWLPPAKAMVLLGAAGSAAAVSRSATQRTTLRRTLRNLAVEAQERADKGRFLTTTSPWPLIEESLRQSFPFETSFLLHLETGSGTLAPVSEPGSEVSRSYFAERALHRDQPPFSTAATNRGATMPDGLVVLPIGHAGRLFGFWVFQPTDDSATEQATTYAGRLASMLDLRDDWRARARPHQLDTDDGAALRVRPLHDQLEGSIELLDGGRKVLAEALDRSMEAVLAYDPFGDLIHVSSRAVELLGSAGIDFSEVPPAQLLATLTGTDPAEIRRTIRFVALNGESAAFQSTAALGAGRQFLVHIRSLHEAALASHDRPALPGTLLLIQDVTQTARAAVLKDEFMERIYFQLNNDFEAVLAASALLNDPRVDAGDREELLTVISEKIEEAAGRMKETRSHFVTEFSPAAVERYPVRFEPVFAAARAAVATDLDSHQVTIASAISDYLQLVLAAPKPLEDLLHAILLTLIHDSREESGIAVEATQAEGTLTITFSNEGFGMPQEKLERYLAEGADQHETLERIGADLVTVQAWGGSLTVRSEVGTGMSFALTLVSVI